MADHANSGSEPPETLLLCAADDHDSSMQPGVSSTGSPRITDNVLPISFVANECLERYHALQEALEALTDIDATSRGIDHDASLALVTDTQSKFKAWGTNIAAFHLGSLPTSLDARLKEAREIRERIVTILRDLKEALTRASLIVSGSLVNRKWCAGALSDSDEDEVADEDEDEEEVEVADRETGVEISELEDLFTAIEAANGSLMKLSFIIRNSPTRDDYLKAASRYSFAPTYGPFDVGHVRETHGSAKRSAPWLTERLGKAITRRREYLKYREDHHSKLSRDWGEIPSDDQRTIAFTKATTFVAPQESLQKDDSDGKESFGSQTSYEPTVIGEDVHKRTPPPPPKFASDQGDPFEYGKPFQCPYCYLPQTVKNKTDWKKHVYRDLKPYVCTFKECELKMFRSRSEWWSHEIHNHRREWICPLCSTQFTKRSTFVGHLSSPHQISLQGSRLDALILKSEEPVDTIPPSACMLCDDWESNVLHPKHEANRAILHPGAKCEPSGTLAQFKRHLGRHMEQLALFALPITEGGEVEEDSSGEDEFASEASIRLDSEQDSLYLEQTIPDFNSDTEALEHLATKHQFGNSDHNFSKPADEEHEPSTSRQSDGQYVELQYADSDSSDDSDFQLGRGEDFPEIPGEAERDTALSEIREQYDKLRDTDENVAPEKRARRPSTPLRDKLRLEKERLDEEKRIGKQLSQTKEDIELEATKKELHAYKAEKEREKARLKVKEEVEEAIEKYKIEMTQKATKEKKEKEEREKEYKKRMEEDLRKSGMDEQQIAVVLKKDKIDPPRPTYTRMSRRHLSVETLNRFRIDYEFDEQDHDYVLIKRWVPEYEQDFLWSHTREIRERRRAEGVSTTQEQEIKSRLRKPDHDTDFGD